MTNLFFSTILSFILCLNPSSSSNQFSSTGNEPDLAWLQGEWEGLGFQYDIEYKSTWTIEFHADVKNDSFIINYPSLKCNGIWMLQSGNHYRATFKENIQKGIDACVTGGTVIITRVDDNHISYTYFYHDNEMIASSTLVRKNTSISKKDLKK